MDSKAAFLSVRLVVSGLVLCVQCGRLVDW